MPTKLREKAVKTDKKIKAKEERAVIKAPSGMEDILPQDMLLWDKLQKLSKEFGEFYNFYQIETPIVESKEIFLKNRGETAERIESELLVIKGADNEELAVRRELRTPAVRSYIEHNLSRLHQPQRLYCFGPVGRIEGGNGGKYSQFHQLGFEILGGTVDPVYDLQVINVVYRFLEEIKIKGLNIEISAAGCLVCRPNYRKKLLNYYKDQGICKDCRKHLTLNPMRVFACKNATCEPIKTEAPSVLDSLCSGCSSHFKHTLEFLEEISLPYTLNPYLVKESDYYNKTVFKIFAEGVRDALASGGRYDYLGESLIGHTLPAVGATLQFRRIFNLVKERHLLNIKPKGKVFLVYIGELAKRKSLKLIEDFRAHNVPILESLGKDSLQTQLEIAAKLNSPLALIFGQKEAYEDSIIIRDIANSTQETMPLKKIVEEVKKRMKNL